MVILDFHFIGGKSIIFVYSLRHGVFFLDTIFSLTTNADFFLDTIFSIMMTYLGKRRNVENLREGDSKTSEVGRAIESCGQHRGKEKRGPRVWRVALRPPRLGPVRGIHAPPTKGRNIPWCGVEALD
jgi:hypothetical protein